jgi:hypothetical protein
MKPIAKSLERPDESRELPNRSDAFVTLGTLHVGRGELRPGWRWSNDVRPIAGTTSCEIRHVGYMLSGTLHIEADDGTTLDVTKGDVFHIPPGHDAWVVGDVAAVLLDWSDERQDFALPPEAVTARTVGARS